MLPKEKIKEQINYWLATSQKDLEVMKALYKDKKYSWSLFLGHLVLEKALKAHVVAATKDLAPKIHHLRRLAEMAQLDLTVDEWKLLVKASDFNMEARYPDEKLEFYKLSDKNYTDEYYKAIISLYKKLCQKIR